MKFVEYEYDLGVSAMLMGLVFWGQCILFCGTRSTCSLVQDFYRHGVVLPSQLGICLFLFLYPSVNSHIALYSMPDGTVMIVSEECLMQLSQCQFRHFY